jgi:REP element-mobilizing transposase RayT
MRQHCNTPAPLPPPRNAYNLRNMPRATPGPKSVPPPRRAGPPHNPGLRDLIEGKRKWHRPERTLPPPPEGSVPRLPAEAGVPGALGTPPPDGRASSFLGWHERGYLPHFDAPYVTQFVTFMLHDAFPVTRRREWEGILNEPDESQRRRKLEAWLDRGHGACWLRRADLASLVEEKLRESDGKSYRLLPWAVMPNHVHLVVDVWATPLSDLLHLWKGGSARAANLALARRGRFWEREYFDTLIRDGDHLKRAIRYTENNPVKAALVAERRAWR